MFKFIDDQLNRITMYRLTMYSLIFLLLAGILFSALGFLSFNPLQLVFSFIFLTGACLLVNQLFAYVYKAPSNADSVYITAFILALIITPPKTLAGVLFLVWASVFAMASKYILAIGKKHVFNPAAFAVALTAMLFGQYASWWAGTLVMAPLVFIIGFLIVRKIKRWDLVLSFFVAAAVMIIGHAFLAGQNVGFIAKALVVDSPVMFFAFIMLTEPATTPPTKKLQRFYGILTGILYAPFVHVGGFYSSPELALLAGNIFSYLVSPKEKLVLTLKEKMVIANDTHDFIFAPIDRSMGLKFKPGQYMEWTLGHKKQDDRGIRRYFTIASSPTESDLRLGVKFYPKPSSYKRALEGLNIGDSIVATQLAGDFTMPKDVSQKLVFIAGGIGVTPFRSMVKYLIDKQERRDVVFFYASTDGFAYQDIFEQAQQQLGIETVYVEGFITKEIIMQNAPDFKERMFYISGPRSMIVSFEKTLAEMGIPNHNIKTDFFPGFA